MSSTTAPRARSVHLPRRLPRRPESFVESPGSICEARRQPCARPGRLRRKEHLVTTDRHAGRVRRLVPACLLAGLIVVAVAAAAPVGTVSYYTDPSISHPAGIAAGPDGALWFTNYSEQLDRADHHRRRGHQLHRPEHQPARSGSRPGRTAPCGSPTTATTRSGGSPPAAPSPTTPTRASAPVRDRGRARRRALVHQRPEQLDRADHDRRNGHATTPIPASTGPERIAAGPDGALWFTELRTTTRSGGSRPAVSSRNYTDPGISSPGGIAAGPDGALWFTNIGQQLDRADHHRRRGHAATPTPASATRTGSRPGPTAPSGSPTTRAARSGGSRRAAPSPTTPTPASATPSGSRRARRRPLVHQRREQLDRADPGRCPDGVQLRKCDTACRHNFADTVRCRRQRRRDG